MLKRDANAKTRRILMPLKMYTLATLGSHHSRPGRNSPSKLRCLVSKIVFYQSLGSKKFLYAKSLKVVFYSEQQSIRPLPPKVRRRMPAFRRDSFSLSPGRPRPIVWPIGLRPLTTADQSERSIRGTQAGCRSVD